jgi:hypothetical protein
MNSFENISFTEVRERAKAKLRQLNTTIDDQYIDLTILDANRRILSRENVCQKQSEPIDVCDYCIDLPCDFRSMIVLTTIPINLATLPIIYTDYPFDAPNGVSVQSFKDSFFTEQGKIRFPSNFEASQVVLFYQAYVTDAEGFPLLKLSHVDYYVFSVIQETFEAAGDYKAAMYYERKKLTAKKALIHNEQATQYELDKVNLRRQIYSILNQNNYGTLDWRGLWQ